MVQITADVIAVANLAFAGMGGNHRYAAIVDQPSSEEADFDGRRPAGTVLVGEEDRLHLVPLFLLDDRQVVGLVRAAAMIDPRDVGRVRQDPVQVASAERPTAKHAAGGRVAHWRANASLLELQGKQSDI